MSQLQTLQIFAIADSRSSLDLLVDFQNYVTDSKKTW